MKILLYITIGLALSLLTGYTGTFYVMWEAEG